jgi:hypothetical protein
MAMAVMSARRDPLRITEEGLSTLDAHESTMAPSICPGCGKAMEPGFLVAESLMGGAKWVRRRTMLAIGGESVAKPDGLGNVYIQGFRCAAYRHLSLYY